LERLDLGVELEEVFGEVGIDAETLERDRERRTTRGHGGIDESLAGNAALTEPEGACAHLLLHLGRRAEMERGDRLLGRSVHEEPRRHVARRDGLRRWYPREELLAGDAERLLAEVGPDLHVVARQVAARFGGERLRDGAKRAPATVETRELPRDVPRGVQVDEVLHELAHGVHRRLARDDEAEGRLGWPLERHAELAELA